MKDKKEKRKREDCPARRVLDVKFDVEEESGSGGEGA